MTRDILKLAVIVQNYGYVGGGERYVRELTERIARVRAFEVHVLANRWICTTEQIHFHKIPIVRFPRWLKPISFAWCVARKLKALDVDLVHTHDRVFKADIATLHGIPHRLWVKEVRKKSMSLFDVSAAWVESHLFSPNGCRKFLPVSTLTKERFLSRFPDISERAEVIHPGVDLTKFNNNRHQSRSVIRSRFGIDDSDIVVLFVGMNFEIKGLDTLMAAVAAAQLIALRKIQLLVVGKGDEKKYEKLSQKLDLKPPVIFAGVIEEEMAEIFLSADLFALLSRFDTFGLVVLEAMAAGLPVVVSETVGAKDLVVEGESGFVVEKDDIQTIASRIIGLTDDVMREKMGAAAHIAASRHGWDTMVAGVLDVYRELMVGK